MWDLDKSTVFDTAQGYRMAYLPEHPNARNGTIFLHRLVMEITLGRLLTADEVVHHRNGNKTDNDPDNLEVTTRSKHASHHAQERLVRGPTMVALVCLLCGKTFDREKRQVHYENSFCSRSCSAKHPRRRRELPHGYGRYRTGCRCAVCRESNNARMRAYKASRKRA